MLSLVLALIGRLWAYVVPTPRTTRRANDPFADVSDHDFSGWG